MRIAGQITGRSARTIESVRSVNLVIRWVHEIFQEGKAVPITSGKGVDGFTPQRADDVPAQLA